MAERGRFELPVGYPTHPFQGCALGHYATSPDIITFVHVESRRIYIEKRIFCKKEYILFVMEYYRDYYFSSR